jgi:Protein of unknown function (DUF3037)
MPSQYSVIQYVPDPIADERINVGILLFDDKTVTTVFLKQWDRVRCFAMEDIHFLQLFQERMRRATSAGLLFPGDQENGQLRCERLRQMSASWMNSIQFTEPRGSLASIEHLYENLPSQFLKEPLVKQKRRLRDRQDAANLARMSIRNVLKRRFKLREVRELLNPAHVLMGHYQSHHFDATVMNGKPYLAAHGISYEVDSPDATTDSVAWMIADVRRKNPTLPLGILMLPPQPKISDRESLQKKYEQKKEIYQNMGAIVLGENELEGWTIEQLKVSGVLGSK